MSQFAAATRVVRRSGASGYAEFDTELDPRWSARDVLQGGYLIAILGRAGGEVVGHDHPHLTSASAVFLHAPRPGPANLRIDVLRTGRTASHLRGQLRQDDRLMSEAHLVHGRLGDADAWWSGHSEIEPPDPGDCVPIPVQPPGVDFRVQLMDVVEERLDPAVLGFAMGRPTGRGLVAGYLRLKDGADWDPLSLQVALDTGPPAHFDLGLGGGAPTVQLTTHIRRLPAPGPVWFELRALDVGDDRMTEQLRLWDSKRRLVGEASQIAAVRIPDGPPPGGDQGGSA
jgi:Thioesterase-like superfamily